MLSQLLIAGLALGQVADDPATFINRELALTYQEQKLTPSEKTSDHEFLRRVALDLIGRIPTLSEQSAFLNDASAKRRALLVDRLLDHDDYARHWANVWTDWLLGSASDETGRQAFHGWLQTHFARNGSHKEMVEKLLLARGTTRDNPALQFYLSYRGQPVPKKKRQENGQYDMIPFTGKVFRILHANRLQCVECHDHPEGNGGQYGFHHMNCFFRQVEFTIKPGKEPTEEVGDNPTFNIKAILPYERLNAVLLYAQPSFYGDVWKKDLKQTRREFFAERFVKHPDFARAYVNFVWTQIFGRSLTYTVDHDDMGEHSPVAHPKILDRLAADFVKSGHDPKAAALAVQHGRLWSQECCEQDERRAGASEVFRAHASAAVVARAAGGIGAGGVDGGQLRQAARRLAGQAAQGVRAAAADAARLALRHRAAQPRGRDYRTASLVDDEQRDSSPRAWRRGRNGREGA
jgi:hypothetical protein